MIGEILHFLRLLFDDQRAGREPDGPLKQQCVHDNSLFLKSNEIGHVLVGRVLVGMRALPALQIPNLKTAATADERDLAFQFQFFAKIVRQEETALFVGRAVLGAGVEVAQENAEIAR